MSKESIKEIKNGLKKLAVAHLQDIDTLKKKAAGENIAAPEESEESILEKIKEWIKENPELAASLGLGAGGALIGSGLGGVLSGGDPMSVLAGTTLGGLAGAGIGYGLPINDIRSSYDLGISDKQKDILGATLLGLGGAGAGAGLGYLLGKDPTSALLGASLGGLTGYGIGSAANVGSPLINKLQEMTQKEAAANAYIYGLIKQAELEAQAEAIADEIINDEEVKTAIEEAVEEAVEEIISDEKAKEEMVKEQLLNEIILRSILNS
ncbi:MAG: hypothetical protein QXO70_03505 [Candidatus Pacearchaeota archaeon]